VKEWGGLIKCNRGGKFNKSTIYIYIYANTYIYTYIYANTYIYTHIYIYANTTMYFSVQLIYTNKK
jgi:hypothetical protein